MNRLGAFATHLGISAMVLAVILYFVFFHWYPDFFFTSDGGGQGLKIVLLVDLVLGPVLTLVVFDRKKPELKRDLATIATIQAVCLAAGVYVVWSERPLALVFVDGMFHSVSTDDYGQQVPDLDPLPGPYPKRVFVDIPEDIVAQSELRRQAWRSGRPLSVEHALYRPYEDLESKFSEAFDLDLLKRNDHNGAFDRWKAKHGAPSDYAFFPFGARYGFQFLGVNRLNGRIEDILDIAYEQKEREALRN